jgi:hypothetical protein
MIKTSTASRSLFLSRSISSAKLGSDMIWANRFGVPDIQQIATRFDIIADAMPDHIAIRADRSVFHHSCERPSCVTGQLHALPHTEQVVQAPSSLVNARGPTSGQKNGE